MRSLHTKFPWKGFVNAWEEGVACMHVPSRLRGSTAHRRHRNKDQSKHHQATQPKIPDTKVEQVLGSGSDALKTALRAHLSAQIPLAHGASPFIQEKYLDLMVNHPVVAASALEEADGEEPLYFREAGDHIIIRGRRLPYHNAHVASMFLLSASMEGRTGYDTMFVVDKHALGINVQLPKFVDDTSLPTPLVCFHDVVIPRHNIIGQIGQAYDLSSITNKLLHPSLI